MQGIFWLFLLLVFLFFLTGKLVDLMDTTREHQKTAASRLMQACTNGLSAESAQALAGVLTSSGMGEFAIPIMRALETVGDGEITEEHLADLLL